MFEGVKVNQLVKVKIGNEEEDFIFKGRKTVGDNTYVCLDHASIRLAGWYKLGVDL